MCPWIVLCKIIPPSSQLGYTADPGKSASDRISNKSRWRRRQGGGVVPADT